MTAMAMVQASMMKAIVRDTYGSPDVLKLGEVEKPELTDDRSWCESTRLRLLEGTGTP